MKNIIGAIFGLLGIYAIAICGYIAAGMLLAK